MSRVYGDGPIPSTVAFFGEYPGIDEIRTGRPFTGRSGREFARYMDGYTLPQRHQVYLSNLKKTPLEEKGAWALDQEDILDFHTELDAVNPSIVVALGARVGQYLLGDGMTLEAWHGIPHFSEKIQRLVVPCYNPAATLHSPGLQAAFAYDMRRVGLLIRGQLAPPPIDDLPRDYTLYTSDVTTALTKGLRRALLTLRSAFDPREGEDVAVDTEGLPGRDWGASWSSKAGTGQVVKAADFPALAEIILRRRPSITLHNALHDLAVLRSMGLDLDDAGLTFDDTMVMAYLLGVEPQGLKPLGYRHCGALHDDYSDIVAVPSARIAEEWIMALAADPRVPEKYQKLMCRMLLKPSDTLRKRWAECRSREVIVEELQILPPWDGDPPEASLDDVPIETAVHYAARDADLTYRVKQHLRPQISAMGLDGVYEADMAILPMVDRMQAVGLGVDLPHFKALQEMLACEIQLNLEAIRQHIGRELNPNSGDQVAELIFDQMALHKKPGFANLRIKKTDSGARLTTNDKVLEALEMADPIMPLIMEGRELTKLKGTYADAIPLLVGRDGRLHPRLRITRTDTGRLSAADPNVLALPKHARPGRINRGKLVRQGFIPGVGRVLGEWDLTQIEMVIFADDAKEERLLEAIRQGADIHRRTAADVVFNKAPEKISEEERFAAKAVNFGILMGMTPFGLMDQLHKNGQLHWTLEMCEDVLRQWHLGYPEASKYIDRKHAEARQYGYVRDRWGRVRYLEGIRSTDPYIRAEAERQAQATPTQSGAQGLMKRAMAAAWPAIKALRAEGLWVELLLQIHDALQAEYEPQAEALLDAILMTALCETVHLSVPVKAKGTMGKLHMGAL